MGNIKIKLDLEGVLLAANTSQWGSIYETTFYTDQYNANYPYNVHIQDIDGGGLAELVIVGTLTDYSWIPTPNPRCSWCNQWQLDAYSWDESGVLTPKHSEFLDVGYDTTVYSAIGSIKGIIKVAGVGNLYPCGSGEPHAGMAMFDNTLQNEHYDWGARQADPCHHDMSIFTSVEIADVDGDGTEEIIAGGSGDSSGGNQTYREWLLAIRTSNGSTFDEELYYHIDHGSGNEILTDLVVADVNNDSTQEIIITGYSANTGVTRTWLRILTWNGTTLQTEHATSFDIGSEDYLHRLAVGNLDGSSTPEIILAGRAKTGSTLDWYVKVLRWDGSSLTEVAHKSWDFGSDAIIQAVKIIDVDADGKNEIVLAGDTAQAPVSGASGGYGYVHYYADWCLKVLTLSGVTWTEKFSRQWASSRDYDSNNNGVPDSGDEGALGRLYDLDVGDLDGDGVYEIVLTGEWAWVGWHLKILYQPTIKGRAYVEVLDTDRFMYVSHPLRNVPMYLWDSSSLLAETTTDENGDYQFSFMPTPGKSYYLAVSLRHGVDDGSRYFQVEYPYISTLIPWVQSQSFTLNPGETRTIDIDFGDSTLTGSAAVPTERRADLALVYYHVKQAFDFMQAELGVIPTYGKPLSVYGFSTSCPNPERSCYKWGDTWAAVHVSQGDIQYGAVRPKGAEWHETFHHLMQDRLTIPILEPGDSNHGGYQNRNTSDSWTEGWAEFWPTVLADTLGEASPYLYNGANFEINWKAWNSVDGNGGQTVQKEDFAVASLLWDLYDDRADCGNLTWVMRDIEHCDHIDLSISQLWAVIGDTSTNNLRDVKDVYDALVAGGIGQGDSDGDGLDDLDEIFALHGFFADTNDNGIYNDGEEIGRAADGARPSRRGAPFVPGAYLKVNFVDQDGLPVEKNTLQVEVSFNSSGESFNYSYFVLVPESTDSLVYLEPPPDPFTTTLRIHPTGGRPETDINMDSGAYWQAVQISTTGYALEHTFIIDHKVYLPLIGR
jgi:hypothetical protein